MSVKATKRAGFAVAKEEHNGTGKPHVKTKAKRVSEREREDHKRKTDIIDDVTATWSS